ncbi:GNAT family N-acetyltransferase [Nitrospira sp. Nam74]
MELRSLEDSDIAVVVGWLSDPQNYQWLDFGNGIQSLSPALLKVMSSNAKHCLKLYSLSDGEHPLGLVALTNIDKHFNTALLWYVLGNKMFANQGHTTAAVSKLLATGFNELGLRAINAWAVEANHPSVRVLEKNGFRYIGKQRACHVVEGKVMDRLLFDLVAEEYRQYSDRHAAALPR